MIQNDGLGEHLLKPHEVAAYLAVPVSTLHFWRRTGNGPQGIRIGRNLRYDPAEVRAYLAARSQAS